MRINICAIGHIKNSPEEELIKDYINRFDRIGNIIGVGPIKVIEKEDKKNKGVLAEGQLLMDSIPTGSIICTLDENGLELDSYGFAKKISFWRDHGNQAVTLIIGGASGLSKGVKEKADLSISLGKMVWPHRLVRVMLAEQLYRAASIISRSPYHKA